MVLRAGPCQVKDFSRVMLPKVGPYYPILTVTASFKFVEDEARWGCTRSLVDRLGAVMVVLGSLRPPSYQGTGRRSERGWSQGG